MQLAGPSARQFAFDVLLQVDGGAYAEAALQARRLEPQEANLAQELVFGVLRFRGQLDFLIQHFSGRVPKLDAEVRHALHLGIYQLRYLDRIPPHAAVSTSVDLVKRARKKSAEGFVNAILRKVNRLDVRWPDLATELSLEPWMLQRWQKQHGHAEAEAIARYFLQRPTAYFRGERQMDIGAQSIVPLLELEPQHRYLDLCAAPGNKTLQAAESGVQPIAADRTRKRLLQIPVRDLVQLDAAQPLPFGRVFDRVLVDAPCSGTGTIGRNPEIKWRVNPEEFRRQAARQREILAHALAVLKPGGRLVYATCSLEPEENEEVLQPYQSRVASAGYRLPGREPGDGFFHAVLA